MDLFRCQAANCRSVTENETINIGMNAGYLSSPLTSRNFPPCAGKTHNSPKRKHSGEVPVLKSSSC